MRSAAIIREVLVEEILNERRKMPDIYMAGGTEDFLLEKNREFHRFLDKYVGVALLYGVQGRAQYGVLDRICKDLHPKDV